MFTEQGEDVGGGLIEDLGVLEDRTQDGEPGDGEGGGESQGGSGAAGGVVVDGFHGVLLRGAGFGGQWAGAAARSAYQPRVAARASSSGVVRSPNAARNRLSSTIHGSVNW